MLFYDWKKIYETCKGNTAEIVRVLKMLVEKQLPVNHYDKIYKYYHIANHGGFISAFQMRLLAISVALASHGSL